MTETSHKRKRVTEDILSSSSNINALAPQDTNKDKIIQIQINVEKLEAQNYKLKMQLESSNVTHEMSLKEKTQQIADLINERNDTKARAIHHKTRADEAAKTLEIMKAKHIEVTNGLRETIVQERRTVESLESALNEQQRENAQIENEANRESEDYEAEIDRLKSNIELLTEHTQDQLETIQSGLNRELDLTNKVTELEKALHAHEESSGNTSNDNLYDDLAEQYQRVCKRTTELESENAKFARELKHYKGVSQNIEYLREERNSLKQQLTKMEEISNAKFILEVENANLQAERDAWTRYLDSKPEYNQQSPGSLVNSLTKQADEAKYLASEVQQLRTELENQNKLVGLLEDHVDELKTVALEKERMVAISEAERTFLSKNDETLKKHISILQGQLQLYDNEEKMQMEVSYDQKKALRIAQLEMFLRKTENQLRTQAQDLTKEVNASVSAIQISNGPYEKLTSGSKIIDFLREMNQQKEQYIQELKEAKAKSQKQFSSMSETREAPQQLQPEATTSTSTNIPTTATDSEQPDQRILSLLHNPASQDYSIRKDLLARLQKENQDLLKSRLNPNALDVATVTVPESSIANLQKQVENLQSEIGSRDKRIDRLHMVWEAKVKETSAQIRSLLGYDIIFRNDGLVRLESIFVDNVELAFLVKEAGNEEEGSILRMVGSHKDVYMQQFRNDYQMYIIEDQNIPAFLNAAALHLYEQHKEKTLVGQEEEFVQDDEEFMQDEDMYEEVQSVEDEEGFEEVQSIEDEEIVEEMVNGHYIDEEESYDEMESIQEEEEEDYEEIEGGEIEGDEIEDDEEEENRVVEIELLSDSDDE